MTILKNAGLAAAIVIGLLVLAVLKSGIPTSGCSGLRECYQALQGTDANERARRGAFTEFTASAQLAALPVQLEGNTLGILLIDRKTHDLRVLTEPAASLFGPRFSRDGKRLVLTRRAQDSSENRWSPTREILSCTVADWRCKRIAEVDGIVRSPVEVNERTILYAMPLPKMGEDFYAATRGLPPMRVTQNLHAGAVNAVSVSEDKITFQAYFHDKTPSIVAPARSEIYQLPFDVQNLKVEIPPKFEAIVLLDGLSVKPAASADGTHLAFLHTVTGKGKYHYKLALGDLVTGAHRIVEVAGKMISLPAFVGDKVSFIELFDDRYELYDYDPATSQKQKVTDIPFSAIKRAERAIPIVCATRCADRAALGGNDGR